MLYTIVGILVMIIDQAVKFWVGKVITVDNPIIQLIPGVLSIVKVQNDGAAFSFLAGGGARIWFIVLTAIFTIAVIIALATNFISGKFGRWCMVLVTAGGLANCIDRVLYGYVLDMFKIELFDFAVFNVADIFISLFCIAFIIYILFGGEKELEKDADEFDEYDEEDDDRPRKVKSDKKSKRPPLKKSEDDEPVSKKRRKPEPEPERREKSSVRRKRDYETSKETAADEFEDYFGTGSRGRRTEAEAEPAPRPRPAAADDTDPFAAWERANAKAKGGPSLYEQAEEKLTPADKPAPAVKPAPRREEKPVTDDFDLDSILNEFK